MSTIAKLRIEVTEEGRKLIEKVRSGRSLSYKDSVEADNLYRIDTYPKLSYSGFRSPTHEGFIRSLESKGYLRIFSDVWADQMELLMGENEDEENKYLVTYSGMSLLNLIAEDLYLPGNHSELGKWLWNYVNEEEEIPPWVLNSLMKKGYLMSVEELEE